MKVCGPMAGALSGRSRVRKPCRTRQRAGPQSRLLTYLGHKEASCVSPGVELSPADPKTLGNRADRDGWALEHRARHHLVGLAEFAPAPTLATAGKTGFQALQGPL